MTRPSLTARKCYCAEGEECSLYCHCDRCRRLPSLKINKVDKDMSREEIKSVLTALNLGEIRQIEIIKVERLVVVVVYFVKWGYNHDMIRLRVKEGNTVKFTFQDAYDISQTWIVEKIEKEPRWFNYNWEKQVEVKVEFEAQHLDVTFPGSCTPRADKKTKEEVELEIKKRDIYYFMKNIYQTYDVVKYEELIETYGEGFMWDTSEYESESDFLDKFTAVEQCYKQTNWIPQINLHPSFKLAKKDYEVVALGLHERPIKDRVYEPEKRVKYLNIIANWTEFGSRPYWLCSGLVNIVYDKHEFSEQSLKKLIPSHKKCTLSQQIFERITDKENKKKYSYKYPLIYRQIQKWNKLISDRVPKEYNNGSSVIGSCKMKYTPYDRRRKGAWDGLEGWGKGYYVKAFQKELIAYLDKENLSQFNNGIGNMNMTEYAWEKTWCNVCTSEQTCYFKDIAMEELMARFWLCHTSEVLVNPENLVGCDSRTRMLVANRARILLSNKVVKVDELDIPSEFRLYEDDDEEDQQEYYYCYFCNKKHIKPVAWDSWQTLYNTVPRCSCQYREITQERIREVRENPTKYVM